MPEPRPRLLDVRTSPIADRIAAVDDFVEAGYEVHLNFSARVIDEGWLEEYAELFRQSTRGVGEAAKRSSRPRSSS